MFSAASTTHIQAHLQKHHSVGKNGVIIEQSAAIEGAKEGAEQLTHCLVTSVDLEQARNIFMELVILDGLTHRQATSPRFKQLFKYLNVTAEGVSPESHSTIERWIASRYVGGEAIVEAMLHESPHRIHISFDGWSSRSFIGVVAVVAHFVDKNGKLWTLPIGLPQILGSKTAENIAALMATVFERFNITHRLGFLIGDNAATNDRVVAILARRCGFAADERRIRCAGHILNLVAKAILYGDGISLFERSLVELSEEEQYKEWRKKSAIGKLHLIFRWIRASPERMGDFKELQRMCPAATLDPEDVFRAYAPPSDGGVRWNSTFHQIDVGKFEQQCYGNPFRLPLLFNHALIFLYRALNT